MLRMMSAPEKIPAQPRPATARPMISVTEFWATPQIKLPTSNRVTAPRKQYLIEK